MYFVEIDSVNTSESLVNEDSEAGGQWHRGHIACDSTDTACHTNSVFHSFLVFGDHVEVASVEKKRDTHKMFKIEQSLHTNSVHVVCLLQSMAWVRHKPFQHGQVLPHHFSKI